MWILGILIYALLMLPWICFLTGVVFAIFFGEVAIKFAVFDFFLGTVCHWLATFLTPHPDNFGLLLFGFFWAVFGMLGSMALGSR